MALRELPRSRTKTYTIDDVWALECDPSNDGRYFYLIDGELFEDPMPNRVHSRLAIRIGRYLDIFAEESGLGEAHVEGSHRPADRSDTLLQPDVSFTRFERLADSPLSSYIRTMPDIAVEIKSPSNSMAQLRRKARAYLQHGSILVWLVLPEQSAVEEWQVDDAGQLQRRLIGWAGTLDGGAALPGFELKMSLLFPPEDNGEDHAS